MRFLCLHGRGTNSQIMETQITGLCHELEDGHTYDFVEGTLPAPLAPEPELKDFFPSEGDYYDYFSFQSAESVEKALDDMTEFLKLEGPYDGFIAFSLGGALAATWLLRQAQLYPNVPLPVKCAVFLSAGAPLDLASLRRGEVVLQTGDDLYLRGFPTAHIWGRNDELWADRSERLCSMCDPQDRVVFLHEEGHSVPGTRAKEALLGCVRAIRRTVGKASMAA